MFDLCKCKCPKMPVVKKCCFCVPIRRGVTIFGYVNLVLSLLSLPFLIFLLVDHLASDAPPPEDHMIDPTVHLPLTIAFMSTDVVMTIILLVGAHKVVGICSKTPSRWITPQCQTFCLLGLKDAVKNKLLLQVYFYFGVGFQLVTLSLDLVYFDYRQYGENMVYLFFLSLNIYLLFLVYNTIQVIQESAEVQYVVYQEERPQII